ncbi:MAG: CapA family protein [Spirochaetales bacterium]|nr:CapA family protein [Spirochaetales bacterium]
MNNKKICLFLIIFLCISGFFFAEDQLKLTFVGDIMAHDVNFQMKDYSKIYEKVKHYFQADDLTFGNLETPINNDLPYSTYPSFNVKEPYVQAAVNAGFDVFSLANNHANDKGDIGVLKTLTALMVLKDRVQGNLYFSGVRGNTSKPFTPEVIYKNGYKIGFLAVTQFLNAPQSTPYVHMVEYHNKTAAKQFLDELKKITPDYDVFIVSFHADVEYVQTPDPVKQMFFRDLANAGVHIIWGHHPHVLQPYETIDVNGARHLIMYSAGNFISGQTYGLTPDRATSARALTGDSAIFRVEISKNTQGKASISNVTPVFISVYKTPENDTIVDTLESLSVSKLPGKWQDFYKSRLRIIIAFFNTMEKYLH